MNITGANYNMNARGNEDDLHGIRDNVQQDTIFDRPLNVEQRWKMKDAAAATFANQGAGFSSFPEGFQK